MDIDDWRQKIDEIDEALLQLLNERARCTMEIGRIKKRRKMPVYDPERERQIFERLQRLNQGPLPQQAVKRLFERIIDESRHLEKDIILALPNRRKSKPE
ncbi:MAG: chorismate mutase [candidate division KSB1 bacterium]|nr:chorismate mutase [candidate division KSB1 bacterium]MDQ7064482.1 chorismate mutase [candidate division KSB1 bacterium]